MTITIESTDQLTEIGGVPCRVWNGTTTAGISCIVFVHRIAVERDADASQFESDLKEMDPPGGPRHLDLRAIL